MQLHAIFNKRLQEKFSKQIWNKYFRRLVWWRNCDFRTTTSLFCTTLVTVFFSY